MTADPHNAPHIQLEMLSQPRFVAGIRSLVGVVAQRLGFGENECGQISLAVDEAICNVINHGYDRKPDGKIWLSIWATDHPERGMRIQIDDFAKQVEPESIRSRDLDDIRPGGLGVHIIQQVMDSAKYEKRSGGGMRLTLYKKLVDSPAKLSPCASTASCTAPSTPKDKAT